MVQFFLLCMHGRFQQQHARNRNDQKQAGITVRKKLSHEKKSLLNSSRMNLPLSIRSSTDILPMKRGFGG